MSTKPLSSSEAFVPAEVSNFIGNGRIAAKIKARPEDFVVEERHGAGAYGVCTVGTDSDLDEETLATSSGKPGLVGVTLVKREKTTFAAAYEVARELGISASRVTYAGLKDRWALTAQRMVIEGVPLDVVRRACRPEPIVGSGWFLKDAAPAKFRLSKGQLLANRFTLNVQVPTMNAAQILEYVTPRLAVIEKWGWVIPNAYGRQRLGKRQNLDQIGKELWENGAEAGIKRFLTEANPAEERPAAVRLREKLKEQWGWFEFGRQSRTVEDIKAHFSEMKRMLEEPMDRSGRPAHEVLNMDVEHKICSRMVQTGDFVEVMRSMQGEFSLWIGAYQSFWFNQLLARVLRGEIALPEVRWSQDWHAGRSEDDRANIAIPEGCIPLLVFDRWWDSKRRRLSDADGPALGFYKEHVPEAIPDRVDPEVKKLFLTPPMTHRGPSIPIRSAMVPVVDLKHHAEDRVWHCQFELKKGGYATTLLGLIFDLDLEDDLTLNEKVRFSRLNKKGGATRSSRA